MGAFDKASLAVQLSGLPVDRQVAFAAACCERLAPTFRMVCELSGAGDPQAGPRLLQAVWDVAGGEQREVSALLRLRDEVESILPEEDEEVGEGYPYAGEFQDALYSALEGAADGDSEALAGAAGSAHTVAFSIALTEVDMDPLDAGPGLDAASASGPVTQEMARQAADLRMLSERSGGSELMAELRERARQDGEAIATAVRQTFAVEEDD